MAEIYLTCNSGSLYSPAFTLADPTRRLMLAIPSLAVPTAVSVQFTTVSGTAPFLAVARDDGTGATHTVGSGPGPFFAPVPHLPTRHGRIAFANSQTNVTTLVILATPARW